MSELGERDRYQNSGRLELVKYMIALLRQNALTQLK
jgi:hypothetical protein